MSMYGGPRVPTFDQTHRTDTHNHTTLLFSGVTPCLARVQLTTVT